ncbi:hypothetical protein J4558_02300 [Leptolyngbya sp. 15MV]|nr:hypothetical protein J4558_02300 [Leptolyngbya sp. 15MV]
MTVIHKSLLLAAAMIGIALLAVFEVIPQEAAQFSPLALMVFLPWAIGGSRRCSAAKA